MLKTCSRFTFQSSARSSNSPPSLPDEEDDLFIDHELDFKFTFDDILKPQSESSHSNYLSSSIWAATGTSISDKLGAFSIRSRDSSPNSKQFSGASELLSSDRLERSFSSEHSTPSSILSPSYLLNSSTNKNTFDCLTSSIIDLSKLHQSTYMRMKNLAETDSDNNDVTEMLCYPTPAQNSEASLIIDSNLEDEQQNDSLKRQPDKDAIKMFVGQIPKSWSEDNFRQYFQHFGDLYQLNILRDKATNDSKGCGFVTFYTRDAAIEAQRSLHDKVVLPGMTHCIQMKPADSENRKERKLFVGMLPKKLCEEDVRFWFSKFGPIEECTVLRNSEDNSSKGCAFVTFVKKADAQAAIRHMNGQVLEGSRGNHLVVKNADSQKDKETKKAASSGSSSALISPLGHSSPQQTHFAMQNSTHSLVTPHDTTGAAVAGSTSGSGVVTSSGVNVGVGSASAAATAAATLNYLNQINTAAAANILASNPTNNYLSSLSQHQTTTDFNSAAAAASLLHASSLSNPIGSLLANQIASAALTQQQQTNQLNSILNATGAFTGAAAGTGIGAAAGLGSAAAVSSAANQSVTTAAALQQILANQQQFQHSTPTSSLNATNSLGVFD